MVLPQKKILGLELTGSVHGPLLHRSPSYGFVEKLLLSPLVLQVARLMRLLAIVNRAMAGLLSTIMLGVFPFVVMVPSSVARALDVALAPPNPMATLGPVPLKLVTRVPTAPFAL